MGLHNPYRHCESSIHEDAYHTYALTYMHSYLHIARNLIRMDEWPSITSYCDPYVKIEFAGSSLNTKVKKGMNPEWNATLAMPVSEPILSDVIKISVYDSDSLSDELIGVFFLSYNDVKNQLVDKEGFGQSRWYNLYGAPRAHQGMSTCICARA